MVFFFSFIIFRTFFVKKKKTKEKEKTERKAFSLPIPLPTFPYYLLEPLLPFLLGVARAGADLFVSMGKERGGGDFHLIFSRGREREKKKNERHSFSRPLSSPSPLYSLFHRPSSCVSSLTVSRGSFCTVERVPESHDSAIAFFTPGRERESFFFLSIDCAALHFFLFPFALERERISKAETGTLFCSSKRACLFVFQRKVRARECVLHALRSSRWRGRKSEGHRRGKKKGDDDNAVAAAAAAATRATTIGFFSLLSLFPTPAAPRLFLLFFSFARTARARTQETPKRSDERMYMF